MTNRSNESRRSFLKSAALAAPIMLGDLTAETQTKLASQPADSTGSGLAPSRNYLGMVPRLSISMWDFSWLMAHYPGGAYEDFEQRVADVAERGYNTLRMDCFPSRILENESTFPKKDWTAGADLLMWDEMAVDYTRNVRKEVARLADRCRKHGIWLGLDSWNAAHMCRSASIPFSRLPVLPNRCARDKVMDRPRNCREEPKEREIVQGLFSTCLNGLLQIARNGQHSMTHCKSGENKLSLTRRKFVGAGVGAMASIVLGSAELFAQRHSVCEVVDDVNPFIGTTDPGLRWTLFPGAAMPFGMVKLSPDNIAWNGRAGRGGAGYNYKIPTILGFSHVHSWTMGGLMMIPTAGPLKLVQRPESGSPESFRSRFRHETESASPGYYAVTLDDYGVRAELTTTTRAGFQRYTFPKSDQARVLLVLDVPGEYAMVVKNTAIRRVSDTEIEGESKPTNDAIYTFQKYELHFVSRFNRSFDSMGGWVGANVSHDTKEIAGEGDVGVLANFRTSEGEAIQVKTRISYVSIEQARLNLDGETNRFGWNFNAVRKNACDTGNNLTGNNLLGKIEVEGGSRIDRTKFYTNLYRSFVGRTIFQRRERQIR
jgi:Glycosyl hydrolase family 92 N-terminal domain/Sugar-binding cellulase-like/Glycosyl hydrolase family 92